MISSNKSNQIETTNCDVRFTACSWFRIITYNFWYSGCFCIGKMFDHLLAFAGQGVDFVFAGVANKGSAPFFLSVLMPIVFISAIIGILRYIKILPLFMKAVGLGLSKINGMGKLESYNGVASAILGQSEVLFP